MGAFFDRKSSKMDNMLIMAAVKTKCTIHTFKILEFSFIILLIQPVGRPNFGEFLGNVKVSHYIMGKSREAIILRKCVLCPK